MISVAADLPACDAEPVHIPGTIQPHGVLVAVDEPQLLLRNVSANVREVLGAPPERVLDRPLGDLLGRDAAEAVAKALQATDLAAQNPLLFAFGGRSFQGVLHRNGACAILELELGPPGDPPVDRALRDVIARLQRAKSVGDLCVLATEQLRALTRFDRVLVYRFDCDGHGEVVAESKAPDLGAFLGHHYPASDIPRQARRLYVRNPIRVIPDARCTPVPLVPPAGPNAPAPLDLTFAWLRGVSPVHLEYLANMEVRASMSLSLVRDDHLWGLVAHHHREPRQVPFAVRSACEIVARLMSLQLEALEEIGTRAQRDAVRAAESTLVASMRSSRSGWAAGLLRSPDALLRVVNATGAAVHDEYGTGTVGDAPSPADAAAIASWLSFGGRHGVYATSALESEYPSAAALASVASGLLAVRIPRPAPTWILWFRREVALTVTWGGNPSRPVAPAPEGPRLHPRRSFASWKELVRGTSAPWTPAELEVAEDLGRRAVEIDLEHQIARAEEAVRARDEIMAVLSHDLKGPLHVIQMSSHLLRAGIEGARCSVALDRIDRAEHRMAVLITELLDLAKIEAGRLRIQVAPCPARPLVADALALCGPMAEERSVRLEGNAVEDVCVLADSDRMLQVLENVLRNAIRFSPKGGTVTVATSADDGSTRFAVRDEGPG
jgi:light-regulated signal transduction histidine kinase (bacteriophytochrome)